MAKKFNKFVIAEDIEKFLRKKHLIKKKWRVVIPEGAYDVEPRGSYEVFWSGSFEVFKNMRDIAGYGKFQALVSVGATSKDDYSLVIFYKGKEYWIYE